MPLRISPIRPRKYLQNSRRSVYLSRRIHPQRPAVRHPAGYARIGGDLVIHGSSASRMMRNLAEEIDICVTVTLIDGLDLARSAFHHSMNYRSVVILGKSAVVIDEIEKAAALEAFTEHIIPGRWPEIRWPTPLELKATTVLRLPIEEASAKIRTGDPLDSVFTPRPGRSGMTEDLIIEAFLMLLRRVKLSYIRIAAVSTRRRIFVRCGNCTRAFSQ